ncbi:MAG TPA: ABC transporter permease [Humisphaera sp.]|jgi:hypothetical protein|nr:ABC transporter permease [Humisphaera sp.]
MIGMFRKELRENAKWAMLIFGIILLSIYPLMRRHDPLLMFELADAPFAYFMPIAGLLLGLAQTCLEVRADNWAFVVHRPVSRRQIFIAKCAAGLLLLFVSLELPCLLAAAWAAKPGNLREPFSARMILPSLAVALNAGNFYFAGMVLTLRRARWLGTRLLPIGLAIACGFAILLTAEFWQTLLLITVAQTISALAAWGVYSTSGESGAGPFSRFALGTMVWAGVIGIGAGIVGFMGIFQTTTSWTQWRMQNDGNAVLVTTHLRDNQRTFSVTDLAGNRLPQFDGVDLDDPAHAGLFVKFRGGLIDNRLIDWPASVLYYRGSYRTDMPATIPLRAIAPPGVRVRAACMFNAQRGLIEMYDPTTRLLSGTVGPSGFTPARATPTDRFASELLNLPEQHLNHTLAFASAVYWLELDHRRVRQIFAATSDDPVISAMESVPEKDPTVFVATRTRLHVLRPGSEVLFTVPLDPDLAHNWYMPTVMSANHHVLLWSGKMAPEGPPKPLVVEYAADGKLIRRLEPPPYRATVSMTPQRAGALGVIYPLAALPLYREWMISWLFQIGDQTWWMFHGWLFASSILCVAVTILLGRRYGMRTGKTAIWSAINLLSGPGGIVAMIALHELPARERCAACGRWRFAGQQYCRHCDKPLPPPAMDGSEIFEPEDLALA